MVQWIIATFVHSMNIKGTDKMLGFLYGVMRGVIIVSVLVFFLRDTRFSEDPLWHSSTLMPIFHIGADFIENHSDDFKSKWNEITSSVNSKNPSQPKTEATNSVNPLGNLSLEDISKATQAAQDLQNKINQEHYQIEEIKK
jgi:uncharacterized membrane protein required for colicin V production